MKTRGKFWWAWILSYFLWNPKRLKVRSFLFGGVRVGPSSGFRVLGSSLRNSVIWVNRFSRATPLSKCTSHAPNGARLHDWFMPSCFSASCMPCGRPEKPHPISTTVSRLHPVPLLSFHSIVRVTTYDVAHSSASHHESHITADMTQCNQWYRNLVY